MKRLLFVMMALLTFNTTSIEQPDDCVIDADSITIPNPSPATANAVKED
jgi:hypothetical protein